MLRKARHWTSKHRFLQYTTSGSTVRKDSSCLAIREGTLPQLSFLNFISVTVWWSFYSTHPQCDTRREAKNWKPRVLNPEPIRPQSTSVGRADGGEQRTRGIGGEEKRRSRWRGKNRRKERKQSLRELSVAFTLFTERGLHEGLSMALSCTLVFLTPEEVQNHGAVI